MKSSPIAEGQEIKVLLRCNHSDDPDVESVWAELISPDTAQLWNIPVFTDEFHFGDLVHIDAEGYATEVILQQTETHALSYDRSGTQEDQMARVSRIKSYFEPHGVAIEPPVPGIVMAARPLTMTESRFEALCEEAPDLIDGEDDEDEESQED